MSKCVEVSVTVYNLSPYKFRCVQFTYASANPFSLPLHNHWSNLWKKFIQITVSFDCKKDAGKICQICPLQGA